METAARSDSIVRFGDFELNLRTRELFKSGSRLRLRGQPVEVLAILVQNPGDLVTRETQCFADPFQAPPWRVAPAEPVPGRDR